MMLASKRWRETLRTLVVLSAALTLTAPAPALALAGPPQESQVTTSDATTGSEGVVEELRSPAVGNQEVSRDDESLVYGEDEDGNADDTVVPAGEPTETDYDPSADPGAVPSETLASEEIAESENELPTQAEPMASSVPASGYSVAEFFSRVFSIVGAGYTWSGYTWTGNAFSSAFSDSGVVDFVRGMPSRSSSPETLYAEVGSRLVYDTSQLNYGDLVFYASPGRTPGHVGIYIGNGAIIDSMPNGGVAVRGLDYIAEFMGGGDVGIVFETRQAGADTPTITDDGGHGTDVPTDIDDKTPAPTKGTDVMSYPAPAPAPAAMSVSHTASRAALPETGGPNTGTVAAVLVVSGICGLLAGRRLRS